MVQKDIVIFGDSFVKPFNLIKSEKIKIYYKPKKTMKGISKKNDVYNCMVNEIKNNKNIKYMIFLFGFVDITYSYFYMKYVKKKKFNMKTIIKNYVITLSNLPIDNKKKIIINTMPNGSGEKEFENKVRYRYSIPQLSKQQRYNEFSIKCRNKRREKFNQILKNYCKEYKIKYIDIDKQLFDKNNCLLEKFIIPNRYDVHIIWEYQLELLTKKLKKYGFELFKPDIREINSYLEKSN